MMLALIFHDPDPITDQRINEALARRFLPGSQRGLSSALRYM
jgi:hypothetical protein